MLTRYLSDVTGTKARWETRLAAHRLGAQPRMAGTAGRSGCRGRAPTKTILPPGASRVVDTRSWRLPPRRTRALGAPAGARFVALSPISGLLSTFIVLKSTLFEPKPPAPLSAPERAGHAEQAEPAEPAGAGSARDAERAVDDVALLQLVEGVAARSRRP